MLQNSWPGATGIRNPAAYARSYSRELRLNLGGSLDDRLFCSMAKVIPFAMYAICADSAHDKRYDLCHATTLDNNPRVTGGVHIAPPPSSGATPPAAWLVKPRQRVPPGRSALGGLSRVTARHAAARAIAPAERRTGRWLRASDSLPAPLGGRRCVPVAPRLRLAACAARQSAAAPAAFMPRADSRLRRRTATTRDASAEFRASAEIASVKIRFSAKISASRRLRASTLCRSGGTTGMFSTWMISPQLAWFFTLPQAARRLTHRHTRAGGGRGRRSKTPGPRSRAWQNRPCLQIRAEGAIRARSACNGQEDYEAIAYTNIVIYHKFYQVI
jgi:hypothetical protein